MTWLIFALGAVLAVAGAVSIASGISYMPVEWGWTEVIAGAVAVSGGVVTLALGAILLRLGALQKAVQRGTYALSANFADDRSGMAPYAADDPGAAPEPAPQLASDPQPAAAYAAESGTGPSEEPPGSTEAAEPAIAPAPEDPSEPSAASTTAEPEVGESPDPAPQNDDAEATARLPWAKLRARFLKPPERLADEPRPEPEPAFDSGPVAAAEAAQAGSAGRLDPEIEARVPSGVPPTGAEPRPAPPVRAAAADDGGPDKAASSRADGEDSFHRVGIANLSASPTIVGRYEAGGASYVLLSDGAIEVETETGTHRFASMQDLKTFIEAQQQHSAP